MGRGGTHLCNDHVPREQEARCAEQAGDGAQRLGQLRHLVHKVVEQLRVARQETHWVDQHLQVRHTHEMQRAFADLNTAGMRSGCSASASQHPTAGLWSDAGSLSTLMQPCRIKLGLKSSSVEAILEGIRFASAHHGVHQHAVQLAEPEHTCAALQDMTWRDLSHQSDLGRQRDLGALTMECTSERCSWQMREATKVP